MADRSIIAWTDNTFNAAMGCEKVSAGCAHCYAETLTRNRMGLSLWGPAATTRRQITSAANWRKPLAWAREAKADPLGGVRGAQAPGRRLVFCGSLFDWAEDHPAVNEARPRLWELIRATAGALDWQILTKRANRIEQCLPADWGDGWPNVWLGTSIEGYTEQAASQRCRADRGLCGCWPCVVRRADHLRRIPAAVRFISYEPALGPLAEHLSLDGLDWIIYGGESGPGYRQHDLAWPRAMRDACDAAGVTWFFKQSAAPRTEQGITLDGAMRRAWPTPRAPQSSPNTSSLHRVAPAKLF